MKTLKVIISLLLFAAATGCNSHRENNVPTTADCMIAACEKSASTGSANVNFSPPADEYDKNGETEETGENLDQKYEPVQTKVPANKKKIIKDGSMSIKAKNIAASKKNMDALLKKFNAYYDLEEYQNNDQSASYTLKLRIPSENFENLLTAIESGKDEITAKSINTSDVTEEYLDIEARLANKREYLKRYKDILLRAGTIKDVLSVEENIRVLQEEIESKEGRLKFLSDQVAYSTLNINLYQQKEYVYKPQEQDKFSERVKSSLSNGWTAMVDFTVGLINIWPVILITLIAIFLIRRIIRKRKAGRTVVGSPL